MRAGLFAAQLPKTSLLIRMLRDPQVVSLSTQVRNPQAIISRYIMRPSEVTELVHSLLVPLIMERFCLFDMRYAETPRLLLEEATTVAEWCLASRALCRMGRISNYLLTGTARGLQGPLGVRTVMSLS